jgi:hypothetical protein
MCGAHSSIGLDETERALWPLLRERLRRPSRLMALMRGVLGSDAEVAAVAAVTPSGIVEPLALLATPAIVDEISFVGHAEDGVRPGRIGDYDVDVIVDLAAGDRPLAVLVSPWIFHNLTLYARKLWSRRP